MGIFRLATTILSLTLLVTCGGGGSGGSTASVSPTTTPPATGGPNTPPTTGDPSTPPTGGGEVINPLAGLANVNVATANSPTIQAVERITGMTGAKLVVSNTYEAENLDKVNDTECAMTGLTCGLLIPEANTMNHILFATANPHQSIFLFNDVTAASVDSTVTEGIVLDDVTLARGNLTPTFIAPSWAPIEFRTFAGWLDGSVFGTTQILIGETNPEYRFISHTAGVPSGSNPSATGSATWEGAAVASIKADRTFILGDAEITVNFTDTDVDLMFDNWRGLDNQAVSSVSAITYNDLDLASGSFTSSKSNEQVQGRFYGTTHAEVGGFFNTETVTGAFGGTRQ